MASFAAIVSTSLQSLSAFASSSGASTSSRTQIGAGFERNAAKINAIAVNACSPPERRERT